MKKCLVSDEEFSKIVKDSFTIAQVLDKLSLLRAGGNYKTVHSRIKKLNLDTSHFLFQGGTSKGRKLGPKRPIYDYFENKCKISSHRLKGLIISSGLKPHQCEKCNLTHWLGSPTPLELHHIDGNRDNNTFSNLEILCPNCHALTENYRGKSKGSKSKRPPTSTMG